jgi:hypothetical protein
MELRTNSPKADNAYGPSGFR